MKSSIRLAIACACAVLFTTVSSRGQAPAIQTIEINQAIGVQKNGALKFVAGKDTGIKTGRHMRMPRGTPLTNLQLALLQRMGCPVESFGDSRGALNIL